MRISNHTSAWSIGALGASLQLVVLGLWMPVLPSVCKELWWLWTKVFFIVLVLLACSKLHHLQDHDDYIYWIQLFQYLDQIHG